MQLMRLARGFWFLIMIKAFNQILTWQWIDKIMFQMPMLLPDLVPFESHVGEKCDEHREKTQPNPLKNCPKPFKRSNYACMSTKYKIKDEKRQNFMYIQWQYPPIRFKTRLKIRPKMCSIYYHILVGRCKVWQKSVTCILLGEHMGT